ncbi:hypothetical protein F3Y22_tig00112800pilonHSYRG00073 [Hibiscus syriacus]|uniref:Uncharacterized protein n=1 Tax=Hibiscus syriacus TaxID=106335 RepID=A0A6A2XQW4_HIBSY|nr:hypothetical protein F3Y22_tig00112800pilonHSYRG00073 [Hibiscus syriacus]
MAEKRSSGGGEVVINAQSEENPKPLNGSAPIETKALDPQQSVSVLPTKSSPILNEISIEKACLTVDKLKNAHFWGLKTWKWCVFVMVMFPEECSSVHMACSILVTWVLLFLDVKRSKTAAKIVDNVTWVLNKFFDRIQESLFYQYIIQTLSGPPLIESAEETAEETTAHLTVHNAKKGIELSTFSYSLYENIYEEDSELADKEVTDEEEAIYVALETGWERKTITNTLSDTNIVVDQLNKLVKAILTVVTFIIWLLLVGKTSETIFQVVIFIFVMHPFDRCVVDDVQDTSRNNRQAEDEIWKHLENSVICHPNHLVAVTEIENDKKLKIVLHCNHTMNFQDFRERNRRRTDLIIELKRITEDLGIRYDLLPEQGNPNQDALDNPDATAYATPDL